jgi:alcohol dehydrogenase class IV
MQSLNSSITQSHHSFDSVMNFEFTTATKIVFGQGAHKQLGAVAANYGRRCFVVTGANPDRFHRVSDVLGDLTYSVYPIKGEPSIEQIEAGVQAAKTFRSELIIGFGGGGAIDAAKAIAGLATNPHEITDYLEVVGQGQPLTVPALPCIAVPTTAGTGAEVTKNSVITAREHRQKVSLRSPYLLPVVALVDSTLTHELPPEMTATTGLDALTQLIEPYVSSRANPLTDALCLKGIECAKLSLRKCFQNGTDIAARDDMALASLFGGIALANAGLGAVHGFAGAIGGMFQAPHGAVCATLLPHVIRANIRALQERAPQHRSLERYRTLALLLTNSNEPEQVAEWVSALLHDLGIKPLGNYGIQKSDIPTIVEKSQRASSMKANPIVLTTEELTAILGFSLGSTLPMRYWSPS